MSVTIDPSSIPAPGRSKFKRRALLGFFLLNIFLFSSLGIWQVQRLGWKLDLIERVNARIHAEPADAPGPTQWSQLTRENAEYRRVLLQGELLPGQEVAVYTNTELGPGYWLFAPLLVRQAADSDAPQAIVWVNRGYLPMPLRDPASRPGAEPARLPATVTGLLRFGDGKHLFLRDNVPQENRWYRRDVKEFSAARTLPQLPVAPYFVDAQASSVTPSWLTPGLTQVNFRNNHLSYAITWFVLAALNVAAFIYLLWFEPRQRRQRPQSQEDA
ncbi:SURF1 family protein [Lampropedia cohaerens]|uniref:SURF1 family protein n=1 Tax=Lampropedia cohaerens TaxID=1610491 RepID=UPI00069B7787|nr:SURF1 family protein [Lampropedia cohaerens]